MWGFEGGAGRADGTPHHGDSTVRRVSSTINQGSPPPPTNPHPTTATYILNLGKTWEKLVLAARVIVAIENPKDVIAISARPYGQRAVLKFAQYTGAQSIAGRFTPGTFTNQITKQFREPRLLVVTDPRTDSQVGDYVGGWVGGMKQGTDGG